MVDYENLKRANVVPLRWERSLDRGVVEVRAVVREQEVVHDDVARCAAVEVDPGSQSSLDAGEEGVAPLDGCDVAAWEVEVPLPVDPRGGDVLDHAHLDGGCGRVVWGCGFLVVG